MVRLVPILTLLILVALCAMWVSSKTRTRSRALKVIRPYLLPFVVVLVVWLVSIGFLYTHQGGIKVL